VRIELFINGVSVYDSGAPVAPAPTPQPPNPPPVLPADPPPIGYQTTEADLPVTWTFGGNKPDGSGWNFSMTCIDGTPMHAKRGNVAFYIDGRQQVGGVPVEHGDNFGPGGHIVHVGAHANVRRVRLTAQ
jgi:hypothetical protein